MLMACLITGGRGVVSIQFLFALTIVLTFSLSFYQLCIYLVQGSKAQYVTYAAARSLFLGDVDAGAQKSRSERVYDDLKQALKLGKLLSAPKIAEPMPYGEAGHRNLFYGVWAPFKGSPGLQLPFLGSASSKGGAMAAVGSYLGREPSQAECKTFNGKRARWICDLYKAPCDLDQAKKSAPEEGDNGC